MYLCDISSPSPRHNCVQENFSIYLTKVRHTFQTLILKVNLKHACTGDFLASLQLMVKEKANILGMKNKPIDPFVLQSDKKSISL